VGFPDCFQGGNFVSWYERETVTILNPHSHPVKVHVQYNFKSATGAVEENVEIPAERVVALHGWQREPTLADGSGIKAVLMHEYAVRLDASAPIVAQTTRRARWISYEPIIGSRSTIGTPVSEPSPACWYYPGGEIVDYGHSRIGIQRRLIGNRVIDLGICCL